MSEHHNKGHHEHANAAQSASEAATEAKVAQEAQHVAQDAVPECEAQAANEAISTEDELLAALQADLAAAQEEQAKTKDSLLRTYAELENLRRRMPEDIRNAQDRAVGQFAQSLLPVIDSLEAALGQGEQSLEDLRTGVELTLKQLQQAFERNQLQTVAPQVGDKQDPNLHQAIQGVPHDTVESDGVVHVVQKGYTLGKRVLRPAMVVVSTGKA